MAEKNNVESIADLAVEVVETTSGVAVTRAGIAVIKLPKTDCMIHSTVMGVVDYARDVSRMVIAQNAHLAFKREVSVRVSYNEVAAYMLADYNGVPQYVKLASCKADGERSLPVVAKEYSLPDAIKLLVTRTLPGAGRAKTARENLIEILSNVREFREQKWQHDGSGQDVIVKAGVGTTTKKKIINPIPLVPAGMVVPGLPEDVMEEMYIEYYVTLLPARNDGEPPLVSFAPVNFEQQATRMTNTVASFIFANSPPEVNIYPEVDDLSPGGRGGVK